MAVTRSINRSMMSTLTGTSFDFSQAAFGPPASPCNVTYPSVNASDSSLKCRALQAQGVLSHQFASTFFFDTSTTQAQHGAAPYKMSEFYDFTLDGSIATNYHVPASGELSIGDASE